MARLQILELPEGTGDDRPPFVLVIDQADEATTVSLGLAPPPDTFSPLEGLQRALGVSVAEQIGARAVLVFEDTIDIPANDTSAFAPSAAALHLDGHEVRGAVAADVQPDFTRPIAGHIEARKQCPYCGDRQMIPTSQYNEHIARLHSGDSRADG